MLEKKYLELEMLRLKSKVSECSLCDILCATRNQTVFGTGNIQARLLICGESPGKEEDKEGVPFVGPAGHMLDRMLNACGWKREDVYITNILCCRPPMNRVPDPVEIHNCYQYLEKQIALVNPQFILCLGSVASNTIIGLPINEARGQWLKYKHHRVLCTYHPSFLLRQPNAKKLAWQDLEILMEEMRKP